MGYGAAGPGALGHPDSQCCAFQMGCGEGCSFSENITVPDTKVNFYAWKRMEVSSFFPSSWRVSF